ncbi:hypothetical protein RhiirC2_804014, partial [Rhizophagus irregularis]
TNLFAPDHNWKCNFCRIEEETFDHFWKCSKIQNVVQDILIRLKIFLVKIIQEYSRDDIDVHELRVKINELGMWDIGCLYDFTFLMKNQVSCQLMELLRCYKITEEKLLYKKEKRCSISDKNKKAKSHSKRTDMGVKNVGYNMLESNWNKWNDLAFHRGGYWANF